MQQRQEQGLDRPTAILAALAVWYVTEELFAPANEDSAVVVT